VASRLFLRKALELEITISASDRVVKESCEMIFTEQERAQAKQHGFTKIDQNKVTNFAVAMAAAEKARVNSVTEALKVYPGALHEIRKYK
jgi:hypothetical protein